MKVTAEGVKRQRARLPKRQTLTQPYARREQSDRLLLTQSLPGCSWKQVPESVEHRRLAR